VNTCSITNIRLFSKILGLFYDIRLFTGEKSVPSCNSCHSNQFPQSSYVTSSHVPVPTHSKKSSAVDIKLTSVFVMLRKCVNHPYLLEFPLDENEDFLVDEQLVTCCGKMMLLDRMLTALLKQGHKVRSLMSFCVCVCACVLGRGVIERGQVFGIGGEKLCLETFFVLFCF